MEKATLNKVEYRVIVYYAGDADIALHAMKSTHKLGPSEDHSLMVAVPEAEAVMIYPVTHSLVVSVGDEEDVMNIPLGGVVTLNHPEEVKKRPGKGGKTSPDSPLDVKDPQ